MFLARTLSYRGAEFDVEEENLSPEYRKMYNECASFWATLKNEVERMRDLIICKCKLTEKEMEYMSRIMIQFWGQHLRFWTQICLGAKIPALVRLAKNGLRNNQCVVIGLQSTGEARSKEYMDRNHREWIKSPHIVSTSRCFLLYILQHLFRTGEEFETKQCIAELVTKKKQLLARVMAMDGLPANPLDSIIDQLGGTSKVAEMTGRTRRIVRRRGHLVYEDRASSDDSPDSINIMERKNFQDGRKLVAIISDAASTGISLQADRRMANQRRRLHITFELPWSADKAVQQLGRTHRANQSSSPIFKLLISSIGAEWRFAAAVASRLEQLGALTQGDRRASSGTNMSEFAVDTKDGRKALKHMLRNFQAALSRTRCPFPELVPDFINDEYSMEMFANQAVPELEAVGVIRTHDGASHERQRKSKSGNVTNVLKFLNRLFGVSLEVQKKIFSAFLQALDQIIANAKIDGVYSAGIVDVSAEKMKLTSQQVLWTDKYTGATVQLCTVSTDRGVAWSVAKKRHDDAKEVGRKACFTVSKNPPVGYPHSSKERTVSLVISRTHQGKALRRSTFYSVQKPNSGYGTVDLRWDAVKAKGHINRDMRTIEKMWKVQYTKAEKACIHNVATVEAKAKHDANVAKGAFGETHEGVCRYGSRIQVIYVLTGSLLGMWDVLRQAMPGRLMKIVRMSTDDGVRVVGIQVPNIAQVQAIKMGIAALQGAPCSAGRQPREAPTAKRSPFEKPTIPVTRKMSDADLASDSPLQGKRSKTKPSFSAASQAVPQSSEEEDEPFDEHGATTSYPAGSVSSEFYGSLEESGIWEEIQFEEEDDATFTRDTTSLAEDDSAHEDCTGRKMQRKPTLSADEVAGGGSCDVAADLRRTTLDAQAQEHCEEASQQVPRSPGVRRESRAGSRVDGERCEPEPMVQDTRPASEAVDFESQDLEIEDSSSDEDVSEEESAEEEQEEQEDELEAEADWVAMPAGPA